MLELACTTSAPPACGVTTGLLGVAEDALGAAGTDTARKVAAELAFGDFEPAFDD